MALNFITIKKHSVLTSMMISSIAIFRALYLGDMLCIIPAVRAIRNGFPEAKIYLIGLPWQREFVQRFPNYFNEFIAFPGWPGLPEQEPDLDKVKTFINEMRSHEFDLVLQMQGNGEITNSMCMLWGGKRMCGLRREGGYAPDHDLFPVSEDGDHEILRFLKLVECLGVPPVGNHLEFPTSSQEQSRIKKILSEAGISARSFVCIHPGARDERRRWPVEKFALVAMKLARAGYPIVLTGSEREQDLLSKLAKSIDTPALNIVERYGHLSAGELAALLGHAKLLVSNDTGVSHIAAALEVPSVILFSPYSDINRWRPLDVQQHIAIPWQRAEDIEYVMQCVKATLERKAERKRVRLVTPDA